MAGPSFLSPYATLLQEQQARNVEIRRVAFAVAGLLAISLVCLLYLNLRTLVVVRSDEVRALAQLKAQKQADNQELAYEIARATAPQRVEERARKLGLAPIERWEPVTVPGYSSLVKTAGQIPRTGPPQAGEAPGKTQLAAALEPEIVLNQLKKWFGLGGKPLEARPTVP